MRVLVTGGCGSIGRWVVHRLHEEGHTPVVYDVRIDERYLRDIEESVVFVRGDVTDGDALAGAIDRHDVDRVIHLAKIIGHRGQHDPVRTLEVNVLGTGRVLEAANAAGIDRVVFASSKSVFAPMEGDHAPPVFDPVTEDAPKFDRKTEAYVPFYTVTNKMSEYFGIRYAMQNDMEFVISRFGNTWGPGKVEAQARIDDDRESVTKYTGGYLVCGMIDRAIEGRGTRVEEDTTDNFVYTKDVAQGVVGMALSEDIRFEGNHREFLIDAGRPFSTSDFAETLSRRFPDLEFEVSDTGSESKHREISCVFDPTRARRELDYDPEFADLEAALDDYVRTEQRASADT